MSLVRTPNDGVCWLRQPDRVSNEHQQQKKKTKTMKVDAVGDNTNGGVC